DLCGKSATKKLMFTNIFCWRKIGTEPSPQYFYLFQHYFHFISLYRQGAKVTQRTQSFGTHSALSASTFVPSAVN
ncbi:MAG: hypothetical protein ACXIUD_18610, partial [Mongoliitalea sp.]